MAAMYFCTTGQSNRKSSTHSAEEWAPHDKDGENDMVACLLSAGSVLRKQFAAICYAEGICHYLDEESILVKQSNGLYAITNLGAILFAKRLNDFPRLSRKAVRVVQYQGNNRLNMLKEYTGSKGYAVGFEGLLGFIDALLPAAEVINGALREKKTAYPILAIREAVGNALIHQDFSIPGTGPVIEIFDGRIEITNPGTPMVDIKCIVDNPPRSRNEKLLHLTDITRQISAFTADTADYNHRRIREFLCVCQ